MYLMERVSNSISKKISETLQYDKENQAVIAYGLYILIQTAWSVLLTLFISILINVLYEVIIFSSAAVSLRRYSGGAHASSPNRCAIIGAVVFNIISLGLNRFLFHANIITTAIFFAICFILVYYIVYRYAPVDSPNKPIKNPEFKKILRRKAFYIISMFLIISLSFMAIYYINHNQKLLYTVICISSGLMWQALTLFYPGKFIICLLDKLLIGITHLRR